MLELGDRAKYIHNQPKTLDLRIENRDYFLGASINVPSEMLGVNLWEEMLQKTQATGREFGAIISSNGKKILTSKIFEGLGENYNHDGEGKHRLSFTPPVLPHGLKSLYPRVKDLVLVHTHPILAKIDHLPTTAMSAADIHVYSNSNYNAIVMVDKGGVHMLTGRDPYRTVDEMNANEIISDAFKVAKNNTSSIAEVITEIAKGLAPFRIKYYFTPDKTPSEDGLILLTDYAHQNNYLNFEQIQRKP